MNITEQTSLISGIYETILDQSRWKDTLSRLAHMADAKSSVLLVTEDTHLNYQCFAASEGWSKRQLFEYWKHFYPQEADIFRRLSKTSVRKFVLDYEFGAKKPGYWDEPLNVWMKEKLGVRHRCGAGLHNHDAWMGVVTLQFPTDRSEVSVEELEEVAGYVQHISKAVEIGRTFSMSKEKQGSIDSAFNRMGQGILILDKGKRIVASNTAAQSVCENKDGLHINDSNTLQIHDPECAHAFEDEIQGLERLFSENVNARTRPVLVRRESGRLSYILEAVPLIDSNGLFESSDISYLVVVTDPLGKYDISVDGLTALYGLTPTEGVVTKSLVSGMSVKQISENRQTSEDTVRTQVKSILNKTGSSGQIDLVRLACMLNPPIF